MYKLNLIAVVSIVVAVSLAVVGMASPITAFAAQHENVIMNLGNMSSMGNMTETENVTTANETGYRGNEPLPILP